MLLTLRAAAERLTVSVTTVRRLTAAGLLPIIRVSPRRVAIPEAAGMPHVRFHDLRHTTASWLINSGVDIYTVGKILGNSGPQTTARYAHLSTATLEQAMRKLR